MAQLCPAKSTIVPFKKQMYSSGSIILSYKDDKCICVSIHAPTRGATKMVCRVDYRGCFNPRTHEGCDSGDAMPDIKAIGFNPRTHEGCDAVLFLLGKSEIWFQSTHPRGVRPASCFVCFFLNGFNPRTHEGCDTQKEAANQSEIVSIHAPTRGATKNRT